MVRVQDIYEGLIWSAKKDINLAENIEVSGELVSEEPAYRYKVGDVVFVKKYYDLNKYTSEPRILGGRWGKIENTNKDSPKRLSEGELYWVVKPGSFCIAGWEKVKDLELITVE